MCNFLLCIGANVNKIIQGKTLLFKALHTEGVDRTIERILDSSRLECDQGLVPTGNILQIVKINRENKATR